MNFSVSICVYKNDDADYFKEALDSLIKQKLPPTEIVIVVDGPIGEKLEGVLESFFSEVDGTDVALNIVRLEKNRGHGEARKVGIEHCRYELVAIADADDLNDYKRFHKQVEYFKNNPSVAIVGGQIMEIAHDTKREISIREVPVEDSDIKEYLKSRCPFNQMSVMFRRDDVIEVGSYVDFYHNEDYYLWVRMYLAGFKFHNISEVLVYVRINEAFYNRRGGWKYFLSEFKLQRIMYKNSIISLFRFVFNSSIRFVLQVLLTDSIRGFIFKKLFRKEVKSV